MGKAEDSFIAKILEKIVGEVKGKVEDLVSRAKKEIISRLENADEIPRLEMLYTVEDSDKTYLSRSLALDLIELLKTYKEKLEPIPEELSEYRQAGLRLINSLLPLVEEYVNCFDILMNGNISRFSRSKGLNYDKILQARKSMKAVLLKMQKLLNDYDKKKYSYEGVKEELRKEILKEKSSNVETIAKTQFERAYKLIGDHMAVHTGEADARKGSSGFKVFDTVDEAVDYYKKNGSPDLAKRLEEAKLYTEGVEDYTQEVPPKFESVKGLSGPKKCLEDAQKEIDEIKKLDPFALNCLKAKKPFMGDCMIPVQNIINCTLLKSNKVISLGANTKDLYDKDGNVNPKFEPSKEGLGVDLKTLLGDDYKQWENQQKVLNAAVRRGLVETMKSLHNKVKKACNQVQKRLEEYEKNKKSKKLPNAPKEYGDFLEGKVKVPSNKDPSGSKMYDILERYDNLNKIYNEVNSNPSLSVEYVAHHNREAEKCLRGCDAWNEKRPEYEEWLESLKIKAEETINASKGLYNVIRKQINSFYKDKKDKENKKRLKSFLKCLSKKYDGLKKRRGSFMSNYKENMGQHQNFLGLKFNEETEQLLDADGKAVAVPAA